MRRKRTRWISIIIAFVLLAVAGISAVHVIDIVLKVQASTGAAIYLDSASGSDANTGLNAAEPVKTFAKAKELMNAEGGDTIYVMSTIIASSGSDDTTGITEVSGYKNMDLSISGGQSGKLVRYKNFGGYLIEVKEGAKLNMQNITVDGGYDGTQSSMAARSLIKVDESTKAPLNYQYIIPWYEEVANGTVDFDQLGTGGRLELLKNVVLENNVIKLDSSSTDTITGSSGGAVYNEGTFVMDDSTEITNCSAFYGGGVYCDKGIFIMYGGNIFKCGYDSYNFTATLNGTTYYSQGGGVAAADIGKVVIKGGDIEKNTAYKGGGVSSGVALVPYSGYSNGYTQSYYYEADPEDKDPFNYTFVLHTTASGSGVCENTAQYGGGIYSEYANYVQLVSGQVSNNTAKSDGGGICTAEDSGIIWLTNALISENTAKTVGGGIAVIGDDSCITMLSVKDGLICENTAGSSKDDIYLGNSSGKHYNTIASTVYCTVPYMWKNRDTKSYVSLEKLNGNSGNGLSIYTDLTLDDEQLSDVGSNIKVWITGNTAQGGAGGGIAAYTADFEEKMNNNNTALIASVTFKSSIPSSERKAWLYMGDTAIAYIDGTNTTGDVTLYYNCMIPYVSKIVDTKTSTTYGYKQYDKADVISDFDVINDYYSIRILDDSIDTTGSTIEVTNDYKTTEQVKLVHFPKSMYTEQYHLTAAFEKNTSTTPTTTTNNSTVNSSITIAKAAKDANGSALNNSTQFTYELAWNGTMITFTLKPGESKVLKMNDSDVYFILSEVAPDYDKKITDNNGVVLASVTSADSDTVSYKGTAKSVKSLTFTNTSDTPSKTNQIVPPTVPETPKEVEYLSTPADDVNNTRYDDDNSPYDDDNSPYDDDDDYSPYDDDDDYNNTSSNNNENVKSENQNSSGSPSTNSDSIPVNNPESPASQTDSGNVPPTNPDGTPVSNSNSTKTGDNSNLAVWIMLLIMSGTCGTCLCFCTFRKSDRH